MSTVRTLQLLLPQPGEDLKSWARSLTAQLQMMLPLLSEYVDSVASSSSGPATAPIYQSDGTTEVITASGQYKLPGGTVIVDADGLHVFDALGFEVIDGPVIRIDTAHIVDAAIETAKLAAGSVTTTTIASDAITTPKLAAGAVVAGKIAANAIVAGDAVIAAAAIVDAQIANLNAAKINAGDIAAERISANIVTALSGKFATLSALAASLGVVQIQAGGALLAGSATTFSTGTGLFINDTQLRLGNPAGVRIEWTGSALNLYNASNQLTVSAGAVDWTYIANISVGTAHIANAAVTTAKIADANITTAKIANANITAAKIADANITTAKIGTAQVDTLRIGGNAVTIPVVATVPAAYYFLGNQIGAQAVTIVSASISLDYAASVMVLFTGEALCRSYNVTAANSAEIRLYVNGAHWDTLCGEIDEGTDNRASLSSTARTVSLGAGTHTIAIVAYTYSAENKQKEYSFGAQRALVLMGAKR